MHVLQVSISRCVYYALLFAVRVFGVHDVHAYTVCLVVVSHHYVCVRVAAFPLSAAVSLCVHVLQVSISRCVYYALLFAVRVFDVHDVHAYTVCLVVVSHNLTYYS